MLKMRHITLLLLLGGSYWVGSKVYNYFFDTRSPHLHITGIVDNDYYAGDIESTISTDKSGDISLWLDDKQLTKKFSLMANKEEHFFNIPTAKLSNGKHILKTEFVDKTYHKNKTILERTFYVDNTPLKAAFLRSGSRKVFQGRTLHVQFQTNKKVGEAKLSALANTYDCFPEANNSNVYECFIPIPCEEAPNEYLLSLELYDKVGNKLNLDDKFQVVFFPFKKEALHVKNEKVTEEKELGRSEKELEQELFKAAQNSLKEKLWNGTFITPVEIQRISCEFGTVRTTQHKGRYAHKAIDIANYPKSVVWSTQDGVVVIKDRFASSGNTVVVDHGQGVLSLFYHLDDFADIEIGQKIAQGNPVGTIGKTGYATGYHLHWEMRINNIPIDPIQWTKTTF